MHKNSLTISFFSRLLLILQLCFGLSLTLYFLGYPFTGKLFQAKSDLLIIESILGTKMTLFSIDSEKAASFEPKSVIQRTLYESLPENEQQKILTLQKNIQLSLQKPFSEQAVEGIKLLTRLPKLELLWAALAIVIPITLLLRNPKALPFVWLFPLIALGFAWNNQVYGFQYKGVFPQESHVLDKKEASKEEWESAWNHYLIREWGKETPSSDPKTFEKQAVKGEFFFNLARTQDLSDDLSISFWERKSLLLLAIYVMWNAFFAFYLTQKLRFY